VIACERKESFFSIVKRHGCPSLLTRFSTVFPVFAVNFSAFNAFKGPTFTGRLRYLRLISQHDDSRLVCNARVAAV